MAVRTQTCQAGDGNRIETQPGGGHGKVWEDSFATLRVGSESPLMFDPTQEHAESWHAGRADPDLLRGFVDRSVVGHASCSLQTPRR